MALPEFSMRQLLEAGVHFGHQTARWNPKMGEYIYGSRNGIHIMDLTQTVPMLEQALQLIRDTVAKGGRILFVGTKRQAQAPIKDAAEKLGIPVVAVVDTNCSPKGVDYVIPGNDDAARAIQLYCDLAARAALDGMSAQLGAAGVDMGAMEVLMAEEEAAGAAGQETAAADA